MRISVIPKPNRQINVLDFILGAVYGICIGIAICIILLNVIGQS